MQIVVLDKKGRILIPKEVRRSIKANAGTAFVVSVEGDKIILKKIGRPSERFAGIFKPKRKIPEDLDEFILEALAEWWKKRESM